MLRFITDDANARLFYIAIIEGTFRDYIKKSVSDN